MPPMACSTTLRIELAHAFPEATTATAVIESHIQRVVGFRIYTQALDSSHYKMALSNLRKG